MLRHSPILSSHGLTRELWFDQSFPGEPQHAHLLTPERERKDRPKYRWFGILSLDTTKVQLGKP